jgi:hypothetical protein
VHRCAALINWQAVRDRQLQFAREAAELVGADAQQRQQTAPPSGSRRSSSAPPMDRHLHRRHRQHPRPPPGAAVERGG